MNNFKEELEVILRRYIPVIDDKDYYDSIIKLIGMRIEELHEKYKYK